MATITDPELQNIWKELTPLERQPLLTRAGVSRRYFESPLELIPLTDSQAAILGSSISKLARKYGVELVSRYPTRDERVFGSDIRDRIRTPLSQFPIGRSSQH